MESQGIFLKGSIPAQQALNLTEEPLPFRYTDTSKARVNCALLVVQIDALKTWNIPLLKWSYPEAVWLLELDYGYLAVAAQTPLKMVPALSFMDKYNTSIGQIEIANHDINAETSVHTNKARFSVVSHSPQPSEAKLISTLWTRSSRGKYYRIPWGDNTPQSTFLVDVAVKESALAEQVFGCQVMWHKQGIAFENRVHECAPAYKDHPMNGVGQ